MMKPIFAASCRLVHEELYGVAFTVISAHPSASDQEFVVLACLVFVGWMSRTTSLCPRSIKEGRSSFQGLLSVSHALPQVTVAFPIHTARILQWISTGWKPLAARNRTTFHWPYSASHVVNTVHHKQDARGQWSFAHLYCGMCHRATWALVYVKGLTNRFHLSRFVN